MDSIGTYNFIDRYKGDTSKAVSFTFKDTDTNLAIDLTGITAKVQFRKSSKRGSVQKELTIGSGLTLTDAVNGILTIDSFLLDWQPLTYYYDVELTFTDSTVKTYIKGTINVIQDTTYA